MRQKRLLALLGGFLVGLLLAGCAPAATPTPAPPPLSKVPVIAAPPVGIATPTPVPLKPTPILVAPAPTPAVKGPKYGGILRTWTRTDIAHYDVHQATTPGVHTFVVSIWSHLVQFDPLAMQKLVVIPDLAEKWDISPDGKSYTFYLQKGVRWHDGKPFTSADVKVSLDRLRNPPKGMTSPRQITFSAVTKVETPDEHTVRVALERPQASFLSTLAISFNAIFPKHILDEKGDLKRNPIGTGPFKLKEYTRGVKFELVKNENYFVKGRPYLDGITQYIIADEQSRDAALKAHRLDLVTGPSKCLSGPDLPILRRDFPQIVIQRGGYSSPRYFVPNIHRAPWNDPRVVKAVKLAIDREPAVEVVEEGPELGQVGGPLPLRGQWAIPEEELKKLPGYRHPKDQDLAEAKRLLAEAGYPKGFKTTMLCRTSTAEKNIAVFLKSELEKIGIEAEIAPKDVAAFYEPLERGAFDTAAAAWAVDDDPDSVFGEHYVTGGGRNYERFSDAEIDKLFVEQSQTMDVAKRRELVQKMERLYIERGSRAVITWANVINAWWPEVKNFTAPATLYRGYKGEEVWLDR